jgi:DNA-binding XRE family transcriptional regulator
MSVVKRIDYATKALQEQQARRAVERDRRDLAEGRESIVPAELAERILAGENPVRAWREHLGMSQMQLAEAAGVGQGYVSDIEKGRRRGSVDVLSRLARSLGVSVEDLMPMEPEPPSGPEDRKRLRLVGRTGSKS